MVGRTSTYCINCSADLIDAGEGDDAGGDGPSGSDDRSSMQPRTDAGTTSSGSASSGTTDSGSASSASTSSRTAATASAEAGETATDEVGWDAVETAVERADASDGAADGTPVWAQADSYRGRSSTDDSTGQPEEGAVGLPQLRSLFRDVALLLVAIVAGLVVTLVLLETTGSVWSPIAGIFVLLAIREFTSGW